MGEILVVGSINMDLVVKVDEIPKPGETLLGDELLQIPGGKGANQGVAIGKLGQDISFLGMVGEDSFGHVLLDSMKDAGVNIDYIEKVNDSTGIAVINVDKEGNNNIVVIPGANGRVDKDYLNRNIAAFKEADIVVFQLEIPLDTVKEGLRIAKSLNKLTVLNPAPAMELDDEIIGNVDILIPNEHELERLTGQSISDEDSIISAAQSLINRGIKNIIVTLGCKGALYINEKEHKLYPAYEVNVVDTTGSGDCFIGGFVSFFKQDKDIEKAIDMGQRTAALSIQKFGAQSSIPTREEVENFMIK